MKFKYDILNILADAGVKEDALKELENYMDEPVCEEEISQEALSISDLNQSECIVRKWENLVSGPGREEITNSKS